MVIVVRAQAQYCGAGCAFVFVHTFIAIKADIEEFQWHNLKCVPWRLTHVIQKPQNACGHAYLSPVPRSILLHVLTPEASSVL